MMTPSDRSTVPPTSMFDQTPTRKSRRSRPIACPAPHVKQLPDVRRNRSQFDYAFAEFKRSAPTSSDRTTRARNRSAVWLGAPHLGGTGGVETHVPEEDGPCSPVSGSSTEARP